MRENNDNKASFEMKVTSRYACGSWLAVLLQLVP